MVTQVDTRVAVEGLVDVLRHLVLDRVQSAGEKADRTATWRQERAGTKAINSSGGTLNMLTKKLFLKTNNLKAQFECLYKKMLSAVHFCDLKDNN